MLAPDEIPVSAQRRTRPGDTSPIIEELPADAPQAPDTDASADPVPAATVQQAPRPVTPTPNPASLRGHYLQTGAFSESKNADAMVERLRKAGFETVGVYPTQGVLKVRLGPYSSTSALEPDRQRLNALGIRAYVVEE